MSAPTLVNPGPNVLVDFSPSGVLVVDVSVLAVVSVCADESAVVVVSDVLLPDCDVSSPVSDDGVACSGGASPERWIVYLFPYFDN